MTTAWCTALAGQYRATLEDLAIVLRGCPDELWEASIYEVLRTDSWVWPPMDRDGQPFAEPERMVQAQSAVWRTASHALYYTDLDLTSPEIDWAPPAPFSVRDDEAYVVPPVYSRVELLGWIDYCRQKADGLFAELTDEQAVAPLAQPHRNGGGSLADVLLQGVMHLQLHSAQVRTFLRSRGIRCSDE